MKQKYTSTLIFLLCDSTSQKISNFFDVFNALHSTYTYISEAKYKSFLFQSRNTWENPDFKNG